MNYFREMLDSMKFFLIEGRIGLYIADNPIRSKRR